MEKQAKNLVHQLLPLPPKSRQIYLKTYDSFMNWRNRQQVNSFTEIVFLNYFNELSKKFQPTSLWSIYSMLKTTVQMKHNIDLKAYTKLTSLLKKLSVGHKCKKSKVFTAGQVETFLKTAPDYGYLATKVALIFGLSGACRGIELANITVDDVKTDTHLQAVNLPNTHSNKKRTFIVKGEYLDIVKKYQAMRPHDVPTNRFFLNFQNGKCTKQVIGRNKFASLPKEIATFLNLENPEAYTGHCFRRTSAALIANTGADLTMLRQYGGLMSDPVAEEYMEDSVESKFEISSHITEAINSLPKEAGPSTSRNCEWNLNLQPQNEMPVISDPTSLYNVPIQSPSSQFQTNTEKTITLNIQNCSNYGEASNVQTPANSFGKLKGKQNYDTWAFSMEMFLIDLDLWEVVINPSIDKSDASLMKKDLKARSKICLSCHESIYPVIKGSKTSYETWNSLKNAYADNGLSKTLTLLQELFSTKLEDDDIESYINKITTLQEELQGIDEAIDDSLLGKILLVGLPEKFKPLIIALENTNSKISSDVVISALLKEVNQDSAYEKKIYKTEKEISHSAEFY